MIQTDAIIFDIDGTLWDSTETCADAWNHVIGKMSSFPPNVTGEQLSKLFGKPMDDIFRALFPTISDAEIDMLGRACEKYENEHLPANPGKIYEGVCETIPKLAKEFPLYIVSNCQKGYIEVVMECLGIAQYIKDYVSFGDRPVSKGDNLKYLVQKHGMKAPIYIGDTNGDANACIEASVPFVFAEYGFGDTSRYAEKITSFDQLLLLCTPGVC